MEQQHKEIRYFKDHSGILKSCIQQAVKSNCTRARCGSVVISDIYVNPTIIGSGYNHKVCDMAGDKCIKDNLPDRFKSDKTCCLHAEQAAIMDMLRRNDNKAYFSHLFFVRVDENNNPVKAGDPFCTICSKMAMFVLIDRFCLWDGDQWKSFQANHYNDISFQYKQKITELSLKMEVTKRQRKAGGRTDLVVGEIYQSEYPIQYVRVMDGHADMSVCFCGEDVITGEYRTDWTRSAFLNF